MPTRAEQAMAVLHVLEQQSTSIHDFIIYTLISNDPQCALHCQTLCQQMINIFDAFVTLPTTQQGLQSWAHNIAKSTYTSEVCALTNPSAGLRFNAANATISQVEHFKMATLESKMLELAPYLSDLFGELLVSYKILENERDHWDKMDDEKEADEEQEEDIMGAAGERDTAAETGIPAEEIEDEDLWGKVGSLSPEDLLLHDERLGTVDSDSEDEPESVTARQQKCRKAAAIKRPIVHRIRRFANGRICLSRLLKMRT
ncbi:hypothetical protein M422DRAFT_270573 [Sphaerobolus stellatus SS14]|uniref:Uncharacterized protein n=1 Tax=Sphaerobolus stellatus (strain SS14) TaxID=990650 RepID=A0A0C9TFL1_SPHS4|nr:hypothetical protein M422DRAFT_270573 [Sphaerobolus stellatus SS14]